METKKCTKCQEVKPLAGFVPTRKNLSAFLPKCRECYRKYNNEYCERNREKVKAYHRKHWRKRNPFPSEPPFRDEKGKFAKRTLNN